MQAGHIRRDIRGCPVKRVDRALDVISIVFVVLAAGLMSAILLGLLAWAARAVWSAALP
jgi:hypothetical protein